MSDIDKTKASDYHDYLVRYCKSHHVHADEAEKHKIIQEVKRSYEESKKGVM